MAAVSSCSCTAWERKQSSCPNIMKCRHVQMRLRLRSLKEAPSRTFSFGPSTVSVLQDSSHFGEHASGEATGDGTGGVVWAGGTLMAHVLYHTTGLVGNLCVAELGCGCGLASIASALGGARKVLAMDIDLSSVYRNLRHNVSVSPNLATVVPLKFRFGEHASLQPPILDQLAGPSFSPDLLVLSDVVYFRELHAPLLKTISWTLEQNPACGLVMTFPRRHADAEIAFLSALRGLVHLEVIEGEALRAMLPSLDLGEGLDNAVHIDAWDPELQLHLGCKVPALCRPPAVGSQRSGAQIMSGFLLRLNQLRKESRADEHKA